MSPDIPLRPAATRRVRLRTPRRAQARGNRQTRNRRSPSRQQSSVGRGISDSKAALVSRAVRIRCGTWRGLREQRAQHRAERQSSRHDARPTSAACGRLPLGRIGDHAEGSEGQIMGSGDSGPRYAIPYRPLPAPVATCSARFCAGWAIGVSTPAISTIGAPPSALARPCATKTGRFRNTARLPRRWPRADEQAFRRVSPGARPPAMPKLTIADTSARRPLSSFASRRVASPPLEMTATCGPAATRASATRPVTATIVPGPSHADVNRLDDWRRVKFLIARHRPKRKELRIAMIAQVEHPRETGPGKTLFVPRPSPPLESPSK